MPTSILAMVTGFSQPLLSTCEEGLFLVWLRGPLLPNISSVSHLHLIFSCVLLRIGGEGQMYNSNNKSGGYSFLFILVGTGMAVAKIGKLASWKQTRNPQAWRGFVSNALSLPYKSLICVFSKRLEWIPNFQKLLIIIITISPQAADNTLFRIITHFDLDKDRIMKFKEVQQILSITANQTYFT